MLYGRAPPICRFKAPPLRFKIHVLNLKRLTQKDCNFEPSLGYRILKKNSRSCYNYQCTIQSINCKPLDHRDVHGDKKNIQRWPERYKHFVCDIFKQRTSELHPCAMKLRQSNFTDMTVTNDWGMLESMSLIKIWCEQRMSVRREFGLGKCYLHRFA